MVRPDAPDSAASYWVVVADEYQAEIYRRDKKFSPLEKLSEMRNETAREKTGDLVSDRGGRAFDSHGQGRHTMAGEKDDPKTHSAVVFAKEIADRLGSAGKNGEFDRFVVVAAPRFLGVLRQALDTVGAEPERSIDKEVTGRDAGFIQGLIDAE